MAAPNLSDRIDQAQDAMVKLRLKIGKISKAQMKAIYAESLPFVRSTNDMLGKVIDSADISFGAYAVMVAGGATIGGVGLIAVPLVAYGEDKWKSEAGALKNTLTQMSASTENYVGLPEDETEWTSYGLLTATEVILDLCQKCWYFYDQFQSSFFAMAANLINSCSSLLNSLLQVVKAVLTFVGETLKGASNALSWIGPLMAVLVPVAAVGLIVYFGKKGYAEVRDAGGRRPARGRSLPPPEDDPDFDS